MVYSRVKSVLAGMWRGTGVANDMCEPGTTTGAGQQPARADGAFAWEDDKA